MTTIAILRQVRFACCLKIEKKNYFENKKNKQCEFLSLIKYNTENFKNGLLNVNCIEVLSPEGLAVFSCVSIFWFR